MAAVFTFEPVKIAVGTLSIVITNFNTGIANRALPFSFVKDFTTEENIEDDANVLRVPNVPLTGLNRTGDFDNYAFNNEGAGGVDARINIMVDEGSGNESLFYGVIDPKTPARTAKEAFIDFSAKSMINQFERVAIADVKTVLTGTFRYALAASSYSAGATTIAIKTLNSTIYRDGIVKNTPIKFDGDSTVYTVTSGGTSQISITPPLGSPLSVNTNINSANQVYTISGNHSIKLIDIVQAVMSLSGIQHYNVVMNMLKFRKAGNTTVFDFTDLGCGWDQFFAEPAAGSNPAQESFFTYTNSKESAGMLAAICKTFMLYMEVRHDPSTGELTLYLRHRNDPASSEISIDYRMDRKIDTDWNNIFNTYDFNFPVGQHSQEQVFPQAFGVDPKKFGLDMCFSQGTSAGYWITVGVWYALTVNSYRLVIIVGNAKYEIDSYWTYRTNGNWMSYDTLFEAVQALCFDLYQGQLERHTNQYATLAGTIGGSTSINNVRLINYMTATTRNGLSQKFYIQTIRRNPFRNITEIVKKAMKNN